MSIVDHHPGCSIRLVYRIVSGRMHPSHSQSCTSLPALHTHTLTHSSTHSHSHSPHAIRHTPHIHFHIRGPRHCAVVSFTLTPPQDPFGSLGKRSSRESGPSFSGSSPVIALPHFRLRPISREFSYTPIQRHIPAHILTASPNPIQSNPNPPRPPPLLSHPTGYPAVRNTTYT